MLRLLFGKVARKAREGIFPLLLCFGTCAGSLLAPAAHPSPASAAEVSCRA